MFSKSGSLSSVIARSLVSQGVIVFGVYPRVVMTRLSQFNSE